jgi:hypothetical protein
MNHGEAGGSKTRLYKTDKLTDAALKTTALHSSPATKNYAAKRRGADASFGELGSS